MGDLDIGMAMVAARIESSRPGKEQGDWEKKESRASFPVPGRRPVDRKPSLHGAKMEVVNGKLILVPSGELPGHTRKKGWTLTREDGSVIRLDTGEVVQPPASRKNEGLR